MIYALEALDETSIPELPVPLTHFFFVSRRVAVQVLEAEDSANTTNRNPG